MPGPPFRSKLEPFLDFIAQERRKRLTWKAIAESIRQQGTPCTPQGVQDYFRRRRKPQRIPLGFESEKPKPEPRQAQVTGAQSILEGIKARNKAIEEAKPKRSDDAGWQETFESEKL
jgi:hypothetical protein